MSMTDGEGRALAAVMAGVELEEVKAFAIVIAVEANTHANRTHDGFLVFSDECSEHGIELFMAGIAAISEGEKKVHWWDGEETQTDDTF